LPRILPGRDARQVPVRSELERISSVTVAARVLDEQLVFPGGQLLAHEHAIASANFENRPSRPTCHLVGLRRVQPQYELVEVGSR
jgi:hypothetical protein